MYAFKDDTTVIVPSGFEYNLKQNFKVMLRINLLHVKNPKFLIPSAEFVLNSFQACMASYNGEYKIASDDKQLLVQFLADHIPNWADEVLG
jgi:hypothetical protein